MSVNRNAPLFLSDGTPVEFVKVTSRGNFQVRVPASHALGAEDPLRIFKPADGSHYKGRTNLTLTNTAPAAAAPVAATAGGPVDHTKPMFLNDGTPVTFSKITRRGRIQVRLPDSHPAAAGQENGWLFEARDGSRYKGRDPQLTLTNTPSASAAPATAAVDTTYAIAVNGSVLSDGFTDYAAAEADAIGNLSSDVRSVQILKVVTSVAGMVGIAVTKS